MDGARSGGAPLRVSARSTGAGAAAVHGGQGTPAGRHGLPSRGPVSVGGAGRQVGHEVRTLHDVPYAAAVDLRVAPASALADLGR
eukprot:1499292-Pyramimonas_sp.AAC.1